MFKRIDNIRPNATGPVNRTSPYDGKKVLMVQSAIIRLFPAALAAMSLSAGGRVGVAEVGEKDGKPVYGIFKTQDTDREDGPNDGKKVGKDGKFSSQVAVEQLGEGNVYELGEAKTDGEGDQQVTYFELNYVETVKLPKKRKAGEAAATEAPDGNAPGETVAPAPTASDSDAVNQAAPAPVASNDDEY